MLNRPRDKGGGYMGTTCQGDAKAMVDDRTENRPTSPPHRNAENHTGATAARTTLSHINSFAYAY